MIRWGISAYNHDASIAVVDDNEILFAAHAERYSGVKNDPNLNQDIIEDALQYGEPDQVHWYESHFRKNIRRWWAGQQWKKNDFRERLREFGVDKRIRYHMHHDTHAAAGLFTSPFDPYETMILVIDAIGEFDTTSIYRGMYTAPGLSSGCMWSKSYPKSLGLFYSAMTHRIGLKPNEDEYILMGMSAYGEPDRFYNHIKPNNPERVTWRYLALRAPRNRNIEYLFRHLAQGSPLIIIPMGLFRRASNLYGLTHHLHNFPVNVFSFFCIPFVKDVSFPSSSDRLITTGPNAQ